MALPYSYHSDYVAWAPAVWEDTFLIESVYCHALVKVGTAFAVKAILRRCIVNMFQNS